MTIPVWVLLAFAMWTALMMGMTVGSYRWAQIFGRNANFATYGEYRIEGPAWYRRALRAHANCIENLPVYGAIVLVIIVAGLDLPILNVLAVTLMVARVFHTIVHVACEQTNRVVAWRSGLFHIQWFCIVAMGVVTAWNAALHG